MTKKSEGTLKKEGKKREGVSEKHNKSEKLVVSELPQNKEAGEGRGYEKAVSLSALSRDK
jgi:hypothetical protein